nr:FxDxF family PEP-CTERM protein [Azohydromonas aeria]
MRWKRPLLPLILAASAAPALAVQVGAGVQLGGISYQLRDLAPDDGQRSWAEMVSRSLVMNALAYSYRPDGRQVTVGGPVFGGADGPLSTTILRGASFANATSFAGNETLWLASSGTAASGAGRYDGFSVTSRYTVAYRLAPHTEMTWTGQASANAWAGLGDVTQAVARVDFGAPGRTLSATGYSDPSLEQPVAFSLGNMDFVLRNDTDRAQRVVATFRTMVAGGSAPMAYSTAAHVAAVPEPETYAMLLAGLGAVGFVARRRKTVA